jgi:cell wall-associated NlpC family hydrolase
MTLPACAVAADAQATNGAGGVSPTAPSTPEPSKTPAKPLLHLAPVVSSGHTSLVYRGPVYQKLATGEVVPYAASAATTAAATTTTAGEPLVSTGGASAGGSAPAGVSAPGKPQLLVPGGRARWINGVAAAPMNAPAVVQQIVWAGDQIIGLPYIYGGGHQSFTSAGYDCSGTVSFALHGGGLLSTPKDSSEFERWGSHGIGRWVTIFSNPGHAYMTVAGLRLDTSAADDPSNQQGPRWRPLRTGNEGYVVRHPLGL